MSARKLRQTIYIPVMAAVLVGAVACNSKSDNDENEIVVTAATVAVKNFYLNANDSVLANLDSVFFSIDLNTGVIFNADSLPKGTNVSKLVPTITFANSMSKAELRFIKDEGEEVTVDYLSNPSDSIDFSHPVALDVTALDGTTTFTYTIKVNVHEQDPDTLKWDRLSNTVLPARYRDPVAQKTIYRNGVAYCLILENNNELTLASSEALNEGIWNKLEVDLGFVPQIDSFTATSDNFWILASDGDLYSSTDGILWSDTGRNWETIIGAYQESILGIRCENEIFKYTRYPEPDGFTETPLEEGFPLHNATQLGVIDTRWTPDPFAILACGTSSDGDILSRVWAFDGQSWAVINDRFLPALENPMMAHYVVYRATQQLFTQREMDVWLLYGGISADDEMNKDVFMSYDNGVTWILAPEKLQWPDDMPYLKGADVIVADYGLSADLADAWTRASYTIDGTEITWLCPYMYIFGGYNVNNVLSTDIWRGVIVRHEFTPVI